MGLAAAIAARRKGFRVTLADSRQPPVDKACGEGLLPDGVSAARKLGLELHRGDYFAIRGIRFQDENTSAVADFPQGPGMGVRRTTLHSALARLAGSAGVELQWGRSIADIGEVGAGWIIGADGGSSRVRTRAGLNGSLRDSRRYGFRLHFHIAPWCEYVEIYWGEGCQIYVTPVADDEVGIAVISGDPKLRVADALRRFPSLAARLGSAEGSSSERGAVTSTRRLRRVTRANVALIGDASGSVDAITAEGLSVGFQHALALADALESGELAQYESAHQRLSVRPRFMAELLLSMDRWPRLRRLALPLMATHPQVFRRLLALHVGLPLTS